MEIVANKEVIAINQDSLGVQAKKVRSEDLGRSSFGLQRSLGAQDFDKIIHSKHHSNSFVQTNMISFVSTIWLVLSNGDLCKRPWSNDSGTTTRGGISFNFEGILVPNNNTPFFYIIDHKLSIRRSMIYSRRLKWPDQGDFFVLLLQPRLRIPPSLHLSRFSLLVLSWPCIVQPNRNFQFVCFSPRLCLFGVWSGLQVRKNGEWIPVTPAQGTLVVNLGDVIQVLSNNKFRSATHRVEYQTLRMRNKTHPPSKPEDVNHITPIQSLPRLQKMPNY
ncbi:hypothetical protein QYF36_007130 [Acer negundo]|nr:hypothetical protein QYF36_007130 [Acer negundo]